jgi:transaldolase
MTDSYFQRVRATTPTRLWINNPTEAEVSLALAQGAAGCTTNPAFGGGLLKRAPDEALPIIRAACAETEDDNRAAELVQLKLVKKLTDAFAPLFESSWGREGFVSIQGAPEADTDGEHILHEAHEGHALAANATPKIPATLPGFYAFERVVADGYPTIVTEVFSLDQLVYACETYLRASEASGQQPPFFMSPITGILGDHLRKVAKASGATIDPADIEWAGVALARACQALVEERQYPVTLLFGGARIPLDFTGLVGGAHAATINYSTVAELVEADPEVADTIHQPVDPAIVERLSATFEDFRRGMQLGALTPEEFEGFGPVQHFRDAFIAGWHGVLGAVAQVRAETATPVA